MNRPLSPHLQVYRLPLTGIISITHRATGVFLAMGLILVVYILFGIARGENSFTEMQAFLNWTIIKLIYWGFVYALFFHLVHGIRHLIWDTGASFELRTMDVLAVTELCISLFLTVITLLYI